MNEFARAIIQLGTKPHRLTCQCHGSLILLHQPPQSDQKKKDNVPQSSYDLYVCLPSL